MALANPHPAICASVFGPLLLSYYPPVRGVILAYQNVALSDEPPITHTSKKSPHKRKRSRREAEDGSDDNNGERGDDKESEGQTVLLRHVDEYSAPFVWATADVLVWRPARGAWIEANVTHQSTTHITLSHLNAFTISVLKQHLPTSWRFYIPSNSTAPKTSVAKSGESHVGGEGYWVDGEGMPVEEVLKVRITDWSAKSGAGEQGKGFMKIEGSLVTEKEEKAVLEKARIEKEERNKRLKSALRRQNGEVEEQDKETQGEEEQEYGAMDVDADE